MSELTPVHLDYRAAFLRYLSRGEEDALHAGYTIGRSAVSDGVSLLDLVQVHHHVLLEVLRDTTHDDLGEVGDAASEFLLEVLATYDMAQRSVYPAADLAD